ncbi:MAG: peptidoglycan DD-metalloendopeptidase family protein [Pseudomonadota bacterium]
MIRCFAVLALAATLVSAGCDAIRYPGDGGEAPRTPPSRGEGDLPGPPPPITPISDPYGTEDPAAPTEPTDSSGPADGGTGDTVDTRTPPDEDDGSGPVETIDASAPQDTGSSDAESSDDGLSTDESDLGDTPGENIAEAGENSTPEAPPAEPFFSYFAPGQLLPGSGTGAFDQIVHAPDMVFPIRSAPAYLQSQVWNFGGGVAGGDQCDSRNFAYPWRDNFCESRTANRGTPFCPLNRVHQGQDIRVGSPEDCRQLRASDTAGRTLHEVVAVEDGLIYDIGTYTVKLRSGGRVYRYMHLNMSELQVAEGDSVEAGDILGYVSNDFGGTPTTFHLHFEIIQNTEAYGWEHVPPYLSLVEAYERREAGRGERLTSDATTASARILPIPEGLEIIE